MNYNWDWGVLIREPYFEWLVSGFLWTISVSTRRLDSGFLDWVGRRYRAHRRQ